MNRGLRSGRWLCLFLLLASGCSGCVPPAVTLTFTPATEVTAAPTLTPTVEATATPIPVPSSTPSSAAVIHNTETRTGIEDIDRLIDVVLEGDADRLQDVLIFTTVGCTHEDGLGGPPKCREGESEGTEVEVFPFLGPEGHFLRRDEAHEWPGIEIAGLYAVYRVSEDAHSEECYPAGQFGIIFVGAQEGYSVVMQVDNGGVVRIDYVLGDSPDSKLEREAEEIILPPPSQLDYFTVTIVARPARAAHNADRTSLTARVSEALCPPSAGRPSSPALAPGFPGGDSHEKDSAPYCFGTRFSAHRLQPGHCSARARVRISG